jgi:ADP-heptose:LPS heptosyltransferase
VRRLVARLDNLGDVLLAGPAVRAVAATAGPVDFLAGPQGSAAARLLPGVADVIVFDAPWVSFRPPHVDPRAMSELIASVAEHAVTEALIITSFHQSPLPLALLLRLSGVDRIGATCVDYPGSLLDVRVPYSEELHEVEQSLALAGAMGHRLPAGDDGRLAISPLTERPAASFPEPYVVVHPGASVSARGLPGEPTREVVRSLVMSGWHVVVTGGSDETDLARSVVPASMADVVSVVAGASSFAGTAEIVRRADVVVCGNTGIAHLAAAVETPVVELFAPVVPAHRWRPWKVPHVLIGHVDIACAGCRARTCPHEGQPCLASYTPDAVLDALGELTGAGRRESLLSEAGPL